MALRPWPLLAAISLLAGTLTGLVAGVPAVHFAYRGIGVHVALETAAALIASLAALLVYGRFRQRRELADLLLVCGLAITAATNLVLAGVAMAAPGAHGQIFITWSGVAGRLLGAILIAAAAFAPSLSLVRWPGATRIAIGSSGLAVVLTTGLVAALSGHLPTGIDPTLSPERSGNPRLVAHPLVHAVQLVAMGLFAGAAVGFARRARATGDGFLHWLAAASVLAAFSRLHYFLFPSLYSEWVYTGDAFRLLFYVVLLGAAAREIMGYQSRLAEAAVLEERRRIARDLHDGLAQELAFIVARAGALMRSGMGELREIAAAGQRALDESRRAIAALTGPLDESLLVVLAEAAEELGGRSGARVVLEADATLDVPARMREDVLRIVREAITNAVGHGEATLVHVRVASDGGLRVEVADNGGGFDTALPNGTGFGLTSMRERARALGGELTVDSVLGRGTEVALVVPLP